MPNALLITAIGFEFVLVSSDHVHTTLISTWNTHNKNIACERAQTTRSLRDALWYNNIDRSKGITCWNLYINQIPNNGRVQFKRSSSNVYGWGKARTLTLNMFIGMIDHEWLYAFHFILNGCVELWVCVFFLALTHTHILFLSPPNNNGKQ